MFAGSGAATIRDLRGALVVLAILAGTGDCGESANWTDARIAGPFVCRADFSLAAVEGVLDSLGSVQTDLAQLLDVAPAKEPIEIYLFHDQATYAAYMKRYLPGVPNRRALYVKSQGPGRVFAFWSREVEVDLRHECTHALLHASLPLVPLWLDEGLAQFFEVGAARRAGGHPHMDGIRWNVRWGQVPKLQTLESKVDVAGMGRTEYRDCWAWVHFMLLGPPAAREELRAYLADIQHNTPPGRLSTRLANRLPHLDALYIEHFRQ
ncbi:MAG: hypothetical protein ABSG68_10225 [Thermoguttaceae bacterium]|jgi:hypothetical protein